MTLIPGANLGDYPEGTSYPMTFEDGILSATIQMMVLVSSGTEETQEIEMDYYLTFFQTADGSLYATLRLSDVPDNPTTMFLLIPME